MKIYIIRHGETDWNRMGRLQGHVDVPLNAQGIRIARLTAEGMKDIPFDRVFTSPLQRAAETAQIIAGDRQIPIVADDRLQEIGFGPLEGLVYRPEKGEVTDGRLMDFFQHPDQYVCPPDGESIEDLMARTSGFLNELIHTEAYRQETILVACHGATLQALTAGIKSTAIADFWKGGVQKNCGVTILEAVDGQVSILEEGRLYYRMEDCIEVS